MEAREFSRRFISLVVGSGVLLGSLTAPMPSVAQNQLPAQPVPIQPRQDGPAAAPGQLQQPKAVSDPNMLPTTKPATIEQGDEVLPINLPAALQLTNTRAWDIIISQQQLRVAAAQLQGANVLWLPSLVTGVNWQHSEGPIQNTDGSLITSTNSSFETGATPLAIFAVTDAIFAPLAQRQVVRAQDANIQTARNDTLTQVAAVYYDALEARADLAAIEDVDRRAEEMVRKAEALGTDQGLIPSVEVARVRAAKANFEEAVQSARQRWRDTSAEVARIARLKPTVLVQPLEPANLRVVLVPPTATAEELIGVALANRPELTFEEAQAEAANERLRQERFRPFLPSIVVSGNGPSPFAVGAYGGGQGSTLNNFGLRSDWNLEAVWELRNLGFGNRALIRERRAEYDLARSNEYRFRDLVAQEVTQAWADVRSADRRVGQAERELKEALISATQNVQFMSEIKRVGGNINILVLRPLEVVASLQALNAAYFDYFGAVADFNRSQFRLYRALGNPAQALAGRDGVLGPPLPLEQPPGMAGIPVPPGRP